MSIEILKDLLKVDQIVGEASTQALVEREIIVPDTRGDIARILDIQGNIHISSKEVVQDRIMVEGVIHYNILYIGEGEDTGFDSMEAEKGFTHYIDIPGVNAKMNAVVKMNLEHIDYELINGRKLATSSVITAYGKVSEVLSLETIDDFKGIEDIEVLRDHIRVSSNAGEGSSQTIIREDFEITDEMPSIQKVLRNNVNVLVKEIKAADNKIIVHGEMDIKILYTGDDSEAPMQVVEERIPFSHFADIQGVYQGMGCDAEVYIHEINTSPKEDINGEYRILGIEMVLGVNAQAYELQEKDIILDAYSPGKALEVKKRSIKLSNIVGENQSQTVIKESISFPDNIPPAKNILYVDARVSVSDERIEEGKVNVEGILETNIIYQSVDNDGMPGSIRESLPFKHIVEIDGIYEDMDCECDLSADHVNFTLVAPDEVELKIVIEGKARVFDTINKELLIEAEEKEDEAMDEGGIFIYFVQPGDSLWTIAKKYNTTTKDILLHNEIDDKESLLPGAKLIIYKKMDVSIA